MLHQPKATSNGNSAVEQLLITLMRLMPDELIRAHRGMQVKILKKLKLVNILSYHQQSLYDKAAEWSGG